MNEIARVLAEVLKNEEFHTRVKAEDLVEVQAMTRMKVDELVLHAIAQQFSGQIRLCEIKARVSPFGEKPMILARSLFLKAHGRSFGFKGECDIQKVKANTAFRIPKMLTNLSLTPTTVVSTSIHSITPSQHNLEQLCPTLWAMIKDTINESAVKLQADQLQRSTHLVARHPKGHRL